MPNFRTLAISAIAAASVADAARVHVARHPTIKKAIANTVPISLPEPETCDFDASLNTNLAVYYGQGADQPRLRHFCDDPDIDIIPIGFVNKFPDQTGKYPGTNFANQCDSPAVYKNPDGTNSQLLKDCPRLGPDIKYCQSKGKKVLLSLGGAIPSTQTVKHPKEFADMLWGIFGPDQHNGYPRPFGDASVDGFDLDIESIVQAGVTEKDLDHGYGGLVKRLRHNFKKTGGKYYISGAPQCVVPDAHLARAIEHAEFDFLFVQFYNTQRCSARAYFDHSYGGEGSDITFDEWVAFVRNAGSQAKIFLGLPASTNEVIEPQMYLEPNEAREIIAHFQCKYPVEFGGAMVYEATASERNAVDNVPYADLVKKDLTDSECADKSTCDVIPSVGLSSSSTPIQTGASSSLPPYSANSTGRYPTGIASGSGSPTGAPISPSGSVRSYPSSSGTRPAFGSTGLPITPSGSVRSYPSGSGTRPPVQPSGSVRSYPSGTGTQPPVQPSGSVRSYPYSSVASGSSSVPFPSGSVRASSGTQPASLSVSGMPPSGSSIVFTGGTRPASASSQGTSPANSISGTSGQPSATSEDLSSISGAPSTSHVTFHFTNSSIPAGSQKTSSTSPAITSSATTQEVVTTHIVTSYVTQVTQSNSNGGSPIVQTSTVHETITKTICKKCIAPPTPAPSASTVEVVTTVIVYTTTTVCPVTKTATFSGIPIKQTGLTTSTITVTETSTICTKCVPPPTMAPAPDFVGPDAPAGPEQTLNASPAHGNSSEQKSNTQSPNGSGSNNGASPAKGNDAQQGSKGPESANNASPAEGNNSPASQENAMASTQNQQASGQTPAQQGNGNSPASGSQASEGQASAPQGNGEKSAQGQQPSGNSAPAAGPEATDNKSPKTMTIEQTLVPIPVYATQTLPLGASQTASATGSGVSAGTTASASAIAGVSPSSSAVGNSPEAFTGAASRTNGGFIGIIIALAAMLMML